MAIKDYHRATLNAGERRVKHLGDGHLPREFEVNAKIFDWLERSTPAAKKLMSPICWFWTDNSTGTNYAVEVWDEELHDLRLMSEIALTVTGVTNRCTCALSRYRAQSRGVQSRRVQSRRRGGPGCGEVVTVAAAGCRIAARQRR